MKRNQKRIRGTASVEAVIMLPVLILMLFGVGYVCRLFSQTFTATDRARLCVQRFAQMACEHEDALPAYCQGVFHKPDESPPEDPDAQDALNSVQETVDEARLDEGVREAESRSTGLTDVLDTLLGEGIMASTKSSAQKPGVLGGGETPIRVGSYALCNTKPVAAKDLAETLYRAFE